MKVLIASITDSGIYRNRRELIERLIQEGCRVSVVAPRSEASDKLDRLGCSCIEVDIAAHGMRVGQELGLMGAYQKILRSERPDLVLTYTIKPNIYVGILCRIMHIPYMMNVTGLGEALMHPGRSRKMLLRLYRAASEGVHTIFFQNESNQHFFFEKGIIRHEHFRMIPGSGVNLNEYQFVEYPSDKDVTRFLFVSRIVRDKGIDELIGAIQIIKSRHRNVEFHFAGGCSEDYKRSVGQWTEEGLMIYHGRVNDMRPLYAMSHCLIHPSYHEGMANVILESAASGRPCLVSDINGCKEAVDDGDSGYVFPVRSVTGIVEKVEQFLGLPYADKVRMGRNAREKMEHGFDRRIVVDAYMDEIQGIETRKVRS